MNLPNLTHKFIVLKVIFHGIMLFFVVNNSNNVANLALYSCFFLEMKKQQVPSILKVAPSSGSKYKFPLFRNPMASTIFSQYHRRFLLQRLELPLLTICHFLNFFIGSRRIFQGFQLGFFSFSLQSMHNIFTYNVLFVQNYD